LDSAKGIKREEFLRAVRAVTGLQVFALLSPFPQSCRSVDFHDFLRRNKTVFIQRSWNPSDTLENLFVCFLTICS
jgi:hypothetical protein